MQHAFEVGCVGSRIAIEGRTNRVWNAISNADKEETTMNSNYVFLCGVMWCRFAQQDAGKELLRAAGSGDPDVKALAWAMFAKGVRRFRELSKRAQPRSGASPGAALCG